MLYRKDYQQNAFAPKKPPKQAVAFRGELRKLMFGCGDVANPNEKSLDLLEAYVEEAFVNLLLQANRRS